LMRELEDTKCLRKKQSVLLNIERDAIEKKKNRGEREKDNDAREKKTSCTVPPKDREKETAMRIDSPRMGRWEERSSGL